MLKQTLQQKLLQKLSPQQIQLMKLLQVPTIELEQRIKEELESNPALDEGVDAEEFEEREWESDNEASDSQEEFDFSDYLDDDTPSYKLSARNKGVDDEDKAVPFVSGSTFRDRLEQQLSFRAIGQKQEMLAKTIIGNLDDDGYLRRDLENISDDLVFSQNIESSAEELQEALAIVQELDPAGVGGRSLQECESSSLFRGVRLREYVVRKLSPRLLQLFFQIIHSSRPNRKKNNGSLH